MTRKFRFGVALLDVSSREEWAKKCRHAEALGYDVLLAPDHLGMPAPFPALVAAAEATQRPRLGTFVLNVGFWNPALLAREVATADHLTGGRLELGLGTGYVRSEHEAAALRWGTPRERVDRLEQTVAELERLLTDEEHKPRPVQQPLPPLLVAGNGNRVLRLAAQHADIVAFAGGGQAPGKPEGTLELLDAAAVADRIAAFRGFAGKRADDIELNIVLQHVTTTGNRRAAAHELAGQFPYLSEDQLLEVPTLLFGTARQMAEQLRERRERYGFSYIGVMESSLDEFAPVIEELRSSGD